MKQVKVVIGANFGDEGKGLMADYFCKKHNGKVLNVLFNGGMQRGHTVVHQGNRRVFHAIGAGSFSPNVRTYMAKNFIVNPIVFVQELVDIIGDSAIDFNLDHKVYVSKECLVTLPCDMLINQFIELQRDSTRHGSCGFGINETLVRNSRQSDKLTIGYMVDNISKLPEIISSIISGYSMQRAVEVGLDLTEEQLELLNSRKIIDNYVEDFKLMISDMELVDDSILSNYEYIVFEGSQGLLLDMDNTEYFPNLTPSNTGLKNVVASLEGLDAYELEVCYVTRSYFTRHGAGRLNSECESTCINKDGLVDLTNQTNMYQGAFRYGYFDTEEIKKAINRDLKYLKDTRANTGLAVTHLNETEGKVATKDKSIRLQELESILGIQVNYTSYSEEAEGVSKFNSQEESKYHTERAAFAELLTEEEVTPHDDCWSPLEWVSEDPNISSIEFEALTRGYITEDTYVHRNRV